MIQDKNTPELPGHISTRTAGMFSTFHLLGLIGRWGAWIVLFASLLITFNAWYFVRGEAIKRAQARFNFRVKTIEAGIYERLQAYEFLLRGGSSLFATSDEVTREDWLTYVTKLQINQYYPGIQGVGFSKQILPSEKEDHLRQIRNEGFPQYTIKPEGDRPEYTSIIFLEPFDWRNQRAFGYDMFSEPTRKEAMIRARDTGIAALSGKVTLVQETVNDLQAGFLIYLAIYRKGGPLETLEQRRDALMGYVYSPFRMNDFMKGILKEKKGYVNLQIFDGEKPLEETLLYRNDTAEELHNAPEGRHFASDQSILTYAGHHWLLSFVSSKHFEENIETGSMNFILLLGITISLLLFVMVLSLTKSRSQAIALANTTLDLEKANIELRKEITERKQAKEELLNEKSFSEAIIESIPGMLYVYDDQGTHILHNKRHEEMTGYSAEELSHLNPLSWYDDKADILRVEAAISDVFTKGYGEVEVPMRIKNGEKLMMHFTGSRLVMNGNKYFVGVGTDITDRKKVEDALSVSHERFLTVLDSIDANIYVADMESHEILFMNKNMMTTFGRDLTGEKCWHGFRDEPKPCKHCTNDQLIDKNGKPTGLCTWQNKNPITGKWYINRDRAIEWPDGRVVKLQISTDITDLKHMEEELRQVHKMESIGTLTGGIAHDFNNIMGIILGNAELALEDVPKWNPGHTNLEEIKKASLRAANIVRQLLSFTRITDQKLQPMEIVLVIKDALTFLRSTIPTTIDIEQNISVTDETILADPTQINQIMMNLCINASHAMEQTGGKLTIIVENVILDDHSAKDYPDLKSGKYIKVVVSDTGPGIDPQIIDRIFDPYFTTKGVGKGSGMGLAVVHGIVKSHSGAIKVDSTLGKGTQFSILFPLAQGKAAVETETIQEIPRGSETILFVDDEISIVNMVQRMFERLGYKVQTATTPQDALDRFALNPDHFDLVITDMTMPQMTGVKLSEKLMDIRPDIPIIICTGHSALVDEEKAKELGLAAYVMKPINMSEVAQTIRKILDRT